MANVYNKPIVVLGGGAENHIDNGMIYEGKYRVRYFDIDGTILKIEYVAEGGNLNPPTNPTYDHNYLIFDEWNYDIENYIVEQPTDIGAIYKTVDDATYLFCRFTTNTGLNPKLGISGATYIDWGDGNIDQNTTHTYVEEGEYVIKIKGELTSTSKLIQGQTGTTSNITASVTKCYLSNINFDEINSVLASTTQLQILSLSKNITNLSNYMLQGSRNLTHINIPNNITIIPSNFLGTAISLKSISMPITITTILSNSFQQTYMKTILLNKNVVSITNPFYQCYGICDYIFAFDTIPAVTSSSFSVNVFTVIWVKDNIIDELKADEFWSTYAAYMKPLSWYPSLTDPNA